MQAGLEHLSWAGGTLRHVDLLLVVAESHIKSLTTAARTIGLAADLGIRHIGLVGNSARDGDRSRLEEFAAGRGVELVAVLPEDPAVRAADRAGACPLDHAPDSPAVAALDELASRLVASRT